MTDSHRYGSRAHEYLISIQHCRVSVIFQSQYLYAYIVTQQPTVMPVPSFKNISDLTKIFFNKYVLENYKRVKSIISDVLGRRKILLL